MSEIVIEVFAAARPALYPIVFALAVGMVVIATSGNNPITAYLYFLGGSFGSVTEFGNMLAYVTPILIEALAVLVAFRAGIFNIGGQGQMYVGAFAGTVVGLTFVDLPGPILIALILLAAAIAGALWSGIAGLLKAYLDVDVVVTTLMLNYIALLFTQYLVNNAFKDPTQGGPLTKPIASQAWLPMLLPPSSLSAGILIALMLVAAVWFLLFRTVWGASVRSVGTNPRFAEAVGVKVRRTILMTMLVSGGIAGLGGALDVMGVQHLFDQQFDPGYGFIGLTIALLARLNPLGVVAMSVLYAVFLNGAQIMQINTNVPYPFVNILTGIIVLLMTSNLAIRLRRHRAST